MESFKRFFTLIELIVVIVILGVLAAIVLPNISSFKEEAEITSVVSNVKNLQTSVDMFMLKNNGATPTKEKASLGNPQTLELFGLQPDYLRKVPENKNIFWWLDDSNKVWASYVDAPKGVSFSVDSGMLTWEEVEEAKSYRIYSTSNKHLISGKAKNTIDYVKEVNHETNKDPVVLLNDTEGKLFLVSAVDRFGLETPAVKTESTYSGYIKPDQSFDEKESINSDVPLKNPNETIDFSKGRTYIEIGNLNNQIVKTISLRIYLKNEITPSSGKQIILQYGNDASQNVIGLGNISNYVSNETLTILGGAGMSYERTATTSNIAAGWHDIKLIWNNELSRYDIYIDGNLHNVTNGTVPHTTPLKFTNLIIGKDSKSIYAPYLGEISDLRLWTTVKQEDNLDFLLTGTEEGLLGCWNFSNREGNVIPDCSPNDFNGILHE